MLDWDDLRYFLAVARSRGLRSAARMLGTSTSTVQRRITQIEQHFGHPIVRRTPGGYRLTSFGELLVPQIDQMRQLVDGMERNALELARDQVGVVKITCPGLIGFVLTEAGLSERFHAQHPSFQCELVMCDKRIELASGEADIALRAGDAGDDRLVGRKLCEAEWFVCAGKRYIERYGAPQSYADISRHRVIAFDDSMAHLRAARWLSCVAPDAKVVARVDTVIGVYLSVRAGVGLAPLPVNLTGVNPEVVEVLGPIPELHSTWRLLTLPKLRHTPRVAAFFDFATRNMGFLRAVLTKGYEPETVARLLGVSK